MITLLIIIWLLIGVAATMSFFNSSRKQWFDMFLSDYLDESSYVGLRLILYASPVLIVGGLLTFILVLIMEKKILLWYRLPKIDERDIKHVDDYRYWLYSNVVKKSNKPFKSGRKVGTPISLVVNPYSGRLSFDMDDGSVVDCFMCKLKN